MAWHDGMVEASCPARGVCARWGLLWGGLVARALRGLRGACASACTSATSQPVLLLRAPARSPYAWRQVGDAQLRRQGRAGPDEDGIRPDDDGLVGKVRRRRDDSVDH